MKLKFLLTIILLHVPLLLAFSQDDDIFLTYNHGGSPMIFIKDNYVSIQRLEDRYKQAEIIIGGGYKIWKNIEDGCAFFEMPEEMKDGYYKVEFYLGTVAAENSYSGSSYIDKGLYIRVKNGIRKLEVNKYVLETNKEFIDKPYSPDFLLRPEEDIQSEDESIQKLAREIAKGSKDDFDKVLAVHDWVAKHIYYDRDAYRAGIHICDAVSVLKSRKSVCQGYANLSAALIRSLGIPCSVVSGYALGIGTSGEWDNVSLNSDSNHAWNFAYPDNHLVIFDATWDSMLNYENRKFTLKSYEDLPDTELNKINSGKGTDITPLRRYYNLTENGLSIDHRITSIPDPNSN